MSTFIVVGLCVGVIVTVMSGLIARMRLAGPLAMVIAGIGVSALMDEDLTNLLYEQSTERAVELILALLLFVDATEVKKGLLGGEPAISARLLLIALPFSLLSAVTFGTFLLPATSVAVLVVIACVVVPTDLAPAAQLLHDRRIPARVRRILNVESGYNDGIVAPIFVVALALIGDNHTDDGVWNAIADGVESTLIAGVVGIAVGFGGARLTRWAQDRALTTSQGMRIGVVLLPVLAYSGATTSSANGFIAAFVCGVAFHAARNSKTIDASELELAEDLAALSSMAMWFLFGATVSYLVAIGLPGWQEFVFVLAALTIIRGAPVALSLIGSDLSRPDRRAIALLGPRGTASIIFGLLAWRGITAINENSDLELDEASLVLYVMVATVLGSVILHGFTTERIGARYARRARDAAEEK
ncbi:cation:proton antiporter domain-containing protein [Rhodococcus erythropolis]|uniref:cation:proton antiporter domain-containing protein n=1 Tax=Rhodococcus erythropolis TaxID=1833 RepID=UPI0037F3542A